MDSNQTRWDAPLLTRREMLCRGGMGIGALALAGVMGDAFGGTPRPTNNLDSPLAPKQPHFPAKAKRVIHLFLNGGPSHVDTFDPKPALDKYHGQQLPESMHLVTERRTGTVMRSPFKFQRHGQSGIEVSEIFSRVGECIDDIAVIRSMQTDVPNHVPSRKTEGSKLTFVTVSLGRDGITNMFACGDPWGAGGNLGRVLIPKHPVEYATGFRFADAAPLLEEEGDPGRAE